MSSLEKMQLLRSILIGIGRNHKKIQVKDEHFTALKLAILKVIERYLLEAEMIENTVQETVQAWGCAYDEIVVIMKEGMEEF